MQSRILALIKRLMRDCQIILLNQEQQQFQKNLANALAASQKF